MAEERWQGWPMRVQVQEEVRRLFHELIHQAWGGGESRVEQWQPRVNIGETEDAYVIEVELPGVTRKDVAVEVEGDTLRIRGERRSLVEQRGCHFLHRELSYGRFERQLRLPETVDQEGIRARFQSGILTVTLPKKRRPSPSGR